MKKLLIILVLITLAGQTTGCFQAKTDAIGFIQGAEDEAEASGEEKIEKEYVPYASLNKTELFVKRSFTSYCCQSGLPPLLDHLTPPPDVTL